jgi:hypothetical protein
MWHPAQRIAHGFLSTEEFRRAALPLFLSQCFCRHALPVRVANGEFDISTSTVNWDDLVHRDYS